MSHRIYKPLTAGVLTLAALFAAFPAHAQQSNQAAEYHVEVVQVDTSRFPEITVWVSVTDAQGNPVGVLPDSAFSLYENGEPMQITGVYPVSEAGEQGAISAVLVIDRSGSMADFGKIEAARAAATTFVDLMRADDQTGVIAFNTQVTVVQPLTSDKAALHQAIAGIEAFDDTAMFDAVSAAEGLLAGVPGRRVIIVLSDGMDNRSGQTLESAQESLQGAGVSVYTIGLGDQSVGTGGTAGIDEASLRAMAEQTNGTYSYAPGPEDLNALYEQISYRIQNEYQLTYISPNALRDGTMRGLDVRIGEAGGVQTGYNPGGVIPETARALEWPIFIALALGLVALLALPDVVRSVGGIAKGVTPFRKKSRVKLTGAEGGSKSASPAPAKPRVRLQGKGG